MGIHVLPSIENGTPRSSLQVVGGRDFSEQLPLEAPRYLADAIPEEHEDGLGCVRGIAMAFGLQAVIVAVIFVVWRLLR
jgi:hypothetical protein